MFIISLFYQNEGRASLLLTAILTVSKTVTGTQEMHKKSMLNKWISKNKEETGRCWRRNRSELFSVTLFNDYFITWIKVILISIIDLCLFLLIANTVELIPSPLFFFLPLNWTNQPKERSVSSSLRALVCFIYKCWFIYLFYNFTFY